MEFLTKNYVKELLLKPLKSSAIHLWMLSKGVQPLAKTWSPKDALEFIEDNKSKHPGEELIVYCGGEDPTYKDALLYYVAAMPDINTEELLPILGRIIANEREDYACAKIRKIAFWVQFWSVFTLISVGIGAIVLLLTL